MVVKGFFGREKNNVHLSDSYLLVEKAMPPWDRPVPMIEESRQKLIVIARTLPKQYFLQIIAKLRGTMPGASIPICILGQSNLDSA